MSLPDSTEPIHLPSPSVWPSVVALGVTLLATGIVTSLAVSVVGVLTFFYGLAGWIQELRHGDH